jgi:hypothetical protein
VVGLNMSTATSTTSAPAPAPAAPSRPLGVAILAILVGIYGFLVFIAGLLVLAGVAVSRFLEVARFSGVSGLLTGIIVIVIGLIIMGVAVGLWHLRMWALVLALIVTFVDLVLYALAGNFISLGFILALIVFVYLLAVHRHFL